MREAWWRAAATVIVAMGAACGHGDRPVPEGPLPGRSVRPYGGIPPSLQPTPPPTRGPVGRYDERVPVAGPAPGFSPTKDKLDEVRLHLARIDVGTVALRAEDDAEATPSETVAEMRADAEALATLVSERPDLVAEAGELEEIALRLDSAAGREREQLLVRVQQLTDLIRIQLAATM